MQRPLRPTVRRCAPAALIAALICYWSIIAPPPPIGIESLPDVTGTASTVLAGVIDLSWLDRQHGIAYAVLALALRHALPDRNISVASEALLAVGIAVGYGALLEAGQLFRPDRVASAADVASNAVGASVALFESESE